ncbi:type VII secretion protein EccB [Mycolicibacterium cosmeticum]|nr:type VII secretion protein EccB [Mycolicibacterium cosmeticum]TLH74514.1 type VII secretion protein EccB [Mycolicibacterium cosmeticum]
MDRRSSTRLLASGHRFLVRRMEYALICRDTRMLDDPIRSQSLALAAGAVLTAIALGICVALSVVTPRGTIGSAPIVIARESGEVYVRVGDTLHSALNLASARLIARTPAAPVLVSAESIAAAQRGPSMGIPGAPATLPAGASGVGAAWTVCDGEVTTVIVGAALDDGPAAPLLVRAVGESAAAVYLLFDGRRAAVDLRDRPVVRALRLEGVEPLPISPALLNLVPEVDALTAPMIDGAGRPGPPQLPASTVGTVLQVRRTDAAPDHYVVLAGGVQRIGQVAADLIRFAVHQGNRVQTVPADRIAEVPVVESLPLDHFPRAAAVPAGADLTAQVCVRWVPGSVGAAPEVTVSVRRNLPPQLQPVSLAQADGKGPRIDAVVNTDGAYVRATGAAGAGAAAGPLFLVDRAGVAYAIDDEQSATSLGMPENAGSGPWPVLALLPRGPALGVARASVQRDAVTAPA